MRNQFKLLNSMLDQAQELIDKGDTASASNIIHMVQADCMVILSDKLTEIEKHLAAIATPFEEATKDGQPINLEQVKPIAKAKGS